MDFKGVQMTTAEMDITTGAQHGTFHAILLQDLMKRAVFLVQVWGGDALNQMFDICCM
jgi:hypothetical protein